MASIDEALIDSNENYEDKLIKATGADPSVTNPSISKEEVHKNTAAKEKAKEKKKEIFKRKRSPRIKKIIRQDELVIGLPSLTIGEKNVPKDPSRDKFIATDELQEKKKFHAKKHNEIKEVKKVFMISAIINFFSNRSFKIKNKYFKFDLAFIQINLQFISGIILN